MGVIVSSTTVFLLVSPETFTQLYSRYNDRLIGYLITYCKNPSDAEDVAQNAWMKLWTGDETYDLSKPFLPYLFGAARYAAIDFSRRKKKGKTETKAWREDFLAFNRPEYYRYSTEDIHEPVAPRKIRKRVYEALRKLPWKQRVRFRKKYWRGYTYKEIAAEEGLTGVESSMWKAKQKFKEYYGEP